MSQQQAHTHTPSFFGLLLSSHRFIQNNNADAGPNNVLIQFQYQAAIAAISIAYFRSTVVMPREHYAHYLGWSCVLAALAYTEQPYEWIVSAELVSYALLFCYHRRRRRRLFTTTATTNSTSAISGMLQLVVALLATTVVCAVVGHLIVSPEAWSWVQQHVMPDFVGETANYMIPIAEMRQAYQSMTQFVVTSQSSQEGALLLQRQVHHLLFVTFHIQVGMGTMGINFLKREQHRRNLLIRMDVADTPDDDDDDADDNDGDKKKNSNHKTKKNAKHYSKQNNTSTNKNEAILERSRRFQRSAGPFILFTALPYMVQIIAYGNMNRFSFMCFQHDLHRTIRNYELFNRDHRLAAVAAETTVAPSAFATSMDSVVSTAYEMFNRKLFSLPKILLLPGVISRQPMLIAQVFPIIFLSDWLKASAVAYMTTQMEVLQKETQDLQAVRTQVESFDLKNAELLQRSGRQAMRYTQDRWESWTLEIQRREIVSDLLSRSKAFFSFMQNNFVFRVLIDCVLANLIAVGKITAADTFVFSRAIEDTVDMVLMRSRAEAELARMLTEINRLDELAEIWSNSNRRNLIHCKIPAVSSSDDDDDASSDSHRSLILRNVHYSRGTAQARADHVELPPGVYGLTGSNGSGKSTLFRVLMSCNTNRKPIDMPASINLLTPSEPLMEEDDALREKSCEAGSLDDDNNEERKLLQDEDSNDGSKIVTPKLSITMPSADIVEISQNFYWPLHSRPIDWIYQGESLDSCATDDVEARAQRIALELHSLDFFQAPRHTDDSKPPPSLEETDKATIARIVKEIQEEKDDWFNDLSGGQKSKVELVRLVFLQDHCPEVLLIDETMAPLDPASKSLVMSKLKAFCSESIVIVIYHTDVARGGSSDDGDDNNIKGDIDCIPSNDFFDRNIHLEKGHINIRDVCKH